MNVWRRCWPVLLPVAAALATLAAGSGGGVARGAPALVVVAGAALLAPGRFTVLCLTTLACAVATWTGGSGLKAVGVLLTDAALVAPFVVAGRALWTGRRRAAGARRGTGSRLAVSARRAGTAQLDSSRSS